MKTQKEQIKETTKTIVGGIATLGVGVVVSTAIDSILPDGAKFLTKVGMAIGGFVIGLIVKDKANEYVNATIDKIFENIEVDEDSQFEEAVEA